MPTKTGALTPQERRFIEAYSRHGDRRKAEIAAGYSVNGGYVVLARPEIQKRILAEQTARLTSDAVPIAVSTLIEIMQSTKAPAAARVQASKVVLDRAMPHTEGAAHKELHEMTPEELAQAIATLEGAAAAVAKNVTPAPDPGGVFD